MGKLVPRVRTTAKILYLIYLFITVVQIILLLFTGMPLFDSMAMSFGTAGTGGFGICQQQLRRLYRSAPVDLHHFHDPVWRKL